MKTRRVGVREAKARLSELLRDARSGTETVITDHGEPVAKLIPMPPAERTTEEVWADLERRGIVGPPPSGPRPSLPEPFDDIPFGRLQEILQEDRGD